MKRPLLQYIYNSLNAFVVIATTEPATSVTHSVPVDSRQTWHDQSKLVWPLAKFQHLIGYYMRTVNEIWHCLSLRSAASPQHNAMWCWRRQDNSSPDHIGIYTHPVMVLLWMHFAICRLVQFRTWFSFVMFYWQPADISSLCRHQTKLHCPNDDAPMCSATFEMECKCQCSSICLCAFCTRGTRTTVFFFWFVLCVFLEIIMFARLLIIRHQFKAVGNLKFIHAECGTGCMDNMALLCQLLWRQCDSIEDDLDSNW